MPERLMLCDLAEGEFYAIIAATIRQPEEVEQDRVQTAAEGGSLAK